MTDTSTITKERVNSDTSLILFLTTGSQSLALSNTHSNNLTLDIWIPVSTLYNLGFVGHWKICEGLGQQLREVAKWYCVGRSEDIQEGKWRAYRKAVMDLPVWDLGFVLWQLGCIERPNLELFSISRCTTVTSAYSVLSIHLLYDYMRKQEWVKEWKDLFWEKK